MILFFVPAQSQMIDTEVNLSTSPQQMWAIEDMMAVTV